MSTVTTLRAGDDFEESPLPPNGAASSSDMKAAAPKPLFGGVSAKTAARAQKGELSTSRTGNRKQAAYSFSKPKKGLFIKVNPDPAYTLTNVPVFLNDATDSWHYITPELYESGELPDRFVRACKLMDIFVVGGADGSFFLWPVPVTEPLIPQGRPRSSRSGAQPLRDRGVVQAGCDVQH